MNIKFASKTLALAAALAFAGSLQAADLTTGAQNGYQSASATAVAYGSRFPTAEMAEQFNSYVVWAAQNGVDVRHAVAEQVKPLPSLDGVLNGNVSATGRFPTQAMEDQFNAYLSWVEKEDLNKDYAFNLVLFGAN